MSGEGGTLGMDAASFEAVQEAIRAFPGDAESAINSVMHGEAGPMIYRRINPLINPSGRTFKGHRASARASDWPSYDVSENLAVTVKAQGSFGYLYFPDDGSDTRRHAGGQEFFRRGGEQAAQEVVDACLGAISREWS